MAVYFFTEDVNYKLTQKLKITKWLNAIAKEHHKKTRALNFIFCSDAFLLNLNQTYLKHNTLTDIITFEYSLPKDKFVSGDIYISIERVGENAKKFNTSPENELHRVLAHGLLHLLGYTDKTKATKMLMRKQEDYWLDVLATYNKADV